MYLNDWEHDGFAGMVRDFGDLGDWKDLNVLLASYGCANYEGNAFVLFQRDGKLYEVHGSHCSCYGLEDQWSPEETNLASLQHRLDGGSLGHGYGDNEFAAELRGVLASLHGARRPQ